LANVAGVVCILVTGLQTVDMQEMHVLPAYSITCAAWFSK